MAVIADLTTRLRTKIFDKAGDGEQFSNTELEAELLDALHRHNRDYTFETLPEAEEYKVILLAAGSCCYAVAARFASKFQLSVEGLSIDKARISGNWLKLGDKYTKEYADAVSGVTAEVEIEVGEMSRYSVQVNRMVNDVE